MGKLTYDLTAPGFTVMFDSTVEWGAPENFNVQSLSYPHTHHYSNQYLDYAAQNMWSSGLKFRFKDYNGWHDLGWHGGSKSSTMCWADWNDYSESIGSGNAGWCIDFDSHVVSTYFVGWDTNEKPYVYDRTGLYFSFIMPDGLITSYPYGAQANDGSNQMLAASGQTQERPNWIGLYYVDTSGLGATIEVSWYEQPQITYSPGADYSLEPGYGNTVITPYANTGYKIDYVEINGVKKTSGFSTINGKDGDNIYIHAVPDQYSLTTTWTPEEGGSVSGAGSYPTGTTVSCTASPAAGYKFVHWEDGNVNPKRTITLICDMTVRATFAQDTVHVDLKASPAIAGTVSGGGDYIRGDVGAINAIPNVGWKFVSWEPAHFTTPYVKVVMDDDWEQTAYFEEVVPVELTLNVVPVGGGVAVGGGSYYEGAEVYISANPNPGYKFLGWSDGSTSATRKITIGSESMILTASFEEIPTYTLTLNSMPINCCTFTGSGKHERNTEAEFKCIPNEGYMFLNWSDGSTDIERKITMDSDKNLTAICEEKKDVVYRITANPFLYGEDKEPYARRIFDYIKQIRYIPLSVEGFDYGEGVLMNKKFTVRGHYDEGTIDYNLYVMKQQFNSFEFSEVLESTGNENRQETTEINSEINEIVAKTNVFKRDLDETVSKLTDMEGNLSRISQRADEIELSVEGKADADGTKLVSLINLAPDNVKISSKNVDIEGDFVTFSDLSGAGQTVINGANITTGKISTDHIDAGSFTMTGGSVNIDAGGTSTNKITLHSGSCESTMSPSTFKVKGSSITTEIMKDGFMVSSNSGYPNTQVLPTGVVHYDANGNITAQIKSDGDIYASHFVLEPGNALQSKRSSGSNRPLIWMGSSENTIHLSNNGNADEVEVHGRLVLDSLASLSSYSTLRISDSTGKVGVASSSARYKDNIQDNESFDVHELYRLPVREYTYKGENEKHLGFIAEEVDACFPVACRYNAEGQPETWEDRDMIPALLQLIQEQNHKIQMLTERVNALEDEDREPATGAWSSF